MIKFLWVPFLLTVMSLSADEHIVVQGENSHGETAAVHACIAYRGCSDTKFSLGGENRLHIFTTKSVSEIEEDLKNCSISKEYIKAIKLEAKDKTYKNLMPLVSSVPINLLSPAILNAKRVENIDKLEAIVMGNTDSEVITQELKKSLGFSFMDYEYKFFKNRDYATTDHITKVIELTDLKELDPFEAIRSVRHEADHVLQFKRFKECDKKSSFGDHGVRERAAYLNDAGFADQAGYGGSFFLNHIQAY